MASPSFIGKSVTGTAGKVNLLRLETNITEPEYEVESPLTTGLTHYNFRATAPFWWYKVGEETRLSPTSAASI